MDEKELEEYLEAKAKIRKLEYLYEHGKLPLIPYKFVRCKICGRYFKSIEYSHLQYKHGVTIEEYEKMFPNSPRISIETLLKLGRVEEAKELERRFWAGELDV